MNSDLTGGKRRARITACSSATCSGVWRAQAERLSLRPEGLRGLLAQGSLPPPGCGQSRLGRGSPGGSLEGSLPRPPGDTLDNATLRGWLHELNMETEAVDDLLDPSASSAAGPQATSLEPSPAILLTIRARGLAAGPRPCWADSAGSSSETAL